MGHTQSKRKKEKKRRKSFSSLVKGVTGDDSDTIHQVAPYRIYRDSVNMDQLSSSSGYFSSESSPPSSGNEVTLSDIQESLSKHMVSEDPPSPFRSPFAFEEVNFDNHPALSKLQNEQNARLENMEQRMAKIKTSALQAYERKKFAHMFRAKKDEGRTERLLQEAREMLEENMEEQKLRKDCENNNDYSGEIIPVKIVEEEQTKTAENDRYLQLSSFDSLNLSDPVMLLLLPFILPLFIIVAVIRGLSETFGWQKHGTFKTKRRNS